MERWYVVNTRPRAEGLALANLDNQGFRAYLPRFLRRRHHARRIETVAAPLFPGYLFVALDLLVTRWRAVHSTIGVKRLVCNGEQPTAVPVGVVEDIRACEDEAGLVIMTKQALFRKGDAVRIMAGALCDQIGLFDCATDGERVIVLLELLGRQVKVRVPLQAVGVCA